jgi:predicted RNA-binding protein
MSVNQTEMQFSTGNKKSTITIDLDQLPVADRYEDAYQQYMQIFKTIALTNAETQINLYNVPWCWVPLLQYLGADVHSSRIEFPHCGIVKAALLESAVKIDRTALEVLCSFRPETIDALWKVDRQWMIQPGRVTHFQYEKNFIVTNNASFDRREIQEFERELADYIPIKKKCVIVPCAADKPYPSPMHEAVRKNIPNDYYIINATGVLGLVPEDLWHVMPHYDSGIPNRWRVLEAVRSYFRRFPHEHVISYSDFYSPAIEAGLLLAYEQQGSGLSTWVSFVVAADFYPDYLPLHEEHYLRNLRAAVDDFNAPQSEVGTA